MTYNGGRAKSELFSGADSTPEKASARRRLLRVTRSLRRLIAPPRPPPPSRPPLVPRSARPLLSWGAVFLRQLSLDFSLTYLSFHLYSSYLSLCLFVSLVLPLSCSLYVRIFFFFIELCTSEEWSRVGGPQPLFDKSGLGSHTHTYLAPVLAAYALCILCSDNFQMMSII